MARRRRVAGTASSIQLLFSSSWAGLFIAALIGGHIILAFVLYGWFAKESGLTIIEKAIGLPAWSLVLWILAGLAIDGWIAYNIRKDRKKALER